MSQALGLDADTLLDHFTALGEDVELTFPLVNVDATMATVGPSLLRC